MRIHFIPLFLLTIAASLLQAQDKTQADVDSSLSRLPNIDSITILQPVDSLKNLVEEVDISVNDLTDSLSFLSQLEDSLLLRNPLESVNVKLDSTKAHLQTFADSLNNEIQLPDSLQQFLPKRADILKDQKLPEADIGLFEEVNEIEGIEEIKNLNEIAEIKSIGNVKEVPALEEISPLKESEELQEIGDFAEKAKDIREKAENGEDLTEAVQREAKDLKGIKALDEQKGEVAKYQEELEQLQDQEHYKEKVLDKAKEKAVDHFAGHTDKLQAAQEKLADIKRKYPEGVSSIKDLPKRRPNPMKGKPFHERLLLGFTIQIHQDETPNIDISPFAAYKITERFSLGLGGNYRLMTRNSLKGLNQNAAVYGYRAFSEFKIHKGFFAHVEYEILRAQKRDSLRVSSAREIEAKTWVDGFLIGIGKEYKIAGHVKGNMQVLYNFLSEISSPYKDKVMVRFGFNFQLKDKLKKPKISAVDSKDFKRKQKIKGKKKVEKLIRRE